MESFQVLILDLNFCWKNILNSEKEKIFLKLLKILQLTAAIYSIIMETRFIFIEKFTVISQTNIRVGLKIFF